MFRKRLVGWEYKDSIQRGKEQNNSKVLGWVWIEASTTWRDTIKDLVYGFNCCQSNHIYWGAGEIEWEFQIVIDLVQFIHKWPSEWNRIVELTDSKGEGLVASGGLRLVLVPEIRLSTRK